MPIREIRGLKNPRALLVIPAQAGIQPGAAIDSRLRGSDWKYAKPGLTDPRALSAQAPNHWAAPGY